MAMPRKSMNRARPRMQQNQHELKFVDLASTTSSIDNAGVDFDLTQLVSQGVTQNERIANVIALSKLEYRFVIKNNTTASTGVRIIVFYDEQDTYIALGDLLLDSASGRNFTAFRDINQLYRFKVLSDKTYNVDGLWKNKMDVRHTVSINRWTRYLASGNTVTSGALRVLMVSDTGTAATTKMAVTGNMRMWFRDE